GAAPGAPRAAVRLAGRRVLAGNGGLPALV
ncbi:MAG: hypothetical protein JWN57_845, partial [Frankiales bacterium]|nr:hypothetical protein [Frankiales bacterium]